MSASPTRARAVLARTLAATALLAAVGSAPAEADNGTALLEIGRLSDGGSTNVNPSTVLAGLSYNEGAGGRFGVVAPSNGGGYGQFSFTPPAGTSITATRLWPRISLYGWPAMGYWT